MPIDGSLLLSNREDERPVKIERLNCCAPRRRETVNSDSLPIEVLRPNVTARVEYRNFVASVRVDGSHLSALAQRARNASERQVVGCGKAASGHRFNMINMEGCLLSDLRKVAVLTTVAAPLNDEPS